MIFPSEHMVPYDVPKYDSIVSLFCNDHKAGWLWHMHNYRVTWWCHQMEKFSALLAICAGNSPVPCEFPAQRPVTRSFDVFFDLRLNKRLNKQSWGWWFEMLSRPLWHHCNELTRCWWDSSQPPLRSHTVICAGYRIRDTSPMCRVMPSWQIGIGYKESIWGNRPLKCQLGNILCNKQTLDMLQKMRITKKNHKICYQCNWCAYIMRYSN